jgi:hypothetical protein
MTTSMTDGQVQFLTVDALASTSYFAQPLDLDYDEPNCVVEEMDVEFVLAEQFVQTVLLPLASVEIEKSGEAKQHSSFKAEQRTAA